MHGMADIITEAMENEQISESKSLPLKIGKLTFLKFINIAMIVIVTVIAIILVDLIRKYDDKATVENANISRDITEINVRPNEDERVDRFIKDYFKARTNLNYPKIFSAYGRDYYSEEREKKDTSFKDTIDNIRYENIFVKDYENINIYTEKGYYENEIICIVTYDMAFGFTSDKAPTIIVFYLVQDGDTFIIKEDFDVGTSKYIVDVVNTNYVKELYNDVYVRLNRVLTSSESLKLVYNSFRQSEMNMKSDLGSTYKNGMVERISSNKLDPIKDAKEIYDEIVSEKRESEKQNALNEYLERVIASLSETQRVS